MDRIDIATQIYNRLAIEPVTRSEIDLADLNNTWLTNMCFALCTLNLCSEFVFITGFTCSCGLDLVK